MSESLSTVLTRLNGMHEKIGADVVGQFGGYLRCEECRHREPLDGRAAGAYLRGGWPRHCGYTMRWWTQRQIDAGEVPA